MDNVVNRLARELADSMAGAVADDPRVEACREKARAAGFEMRVSIEAVIGFVNRSTTPRALPKVGTPIQSIAARTGLEITATDRRFLRSLRIAVDETSQKVE